MGNDWFSGFSRLAKGSKARADAVNALFDQIVTGMDKMPTEIQMNSGTRNYIDTDTGAADAYAGSLSHVTGSYADGQEVDILIANANLTTTPTLNVSAIGATIIKASGANSVAIGALAANSIARFKYNDTLSYWELIGVYNITNAVSAFMATMLDDETATEALSTLGVVSGNWTPTVEGGTTAGAGWVYATQYGHYQIVGKIAIYTFTVDVSTIGSGAAGTIDVKGFPNNGKNATYTRYGAANISGITLPTGWNEFLIMNHSNLDSINVVASSHISSSRVVMYITDITGTSFGIEGTIIIELP